MRAARILLIWIGTTLPALAGDGFDLVIPGRAGVPIIVNGIDASYAAVEGDWGLAHGVHVQPTVYGGRIVDPEPRVGHYYPSAGQMPGYGRLEIEPPKDRKLPRPAASYHRSWSAQSAPPAAQPGVPGDPPAVMVAPPEAGAFGLPQAAPGSPQAFRSSNRRKYRN